MNIDHTFANQSLHPMPDASQRWSYSVKPIGFMNRVKESLQLMRKHWRISDSVIHSTVQGYEKIKHSAEELMRVQIKDKRILEIGPGQQLRFMRCFSIDNEVVGIDTDVILDEFSMHGLLTMLRANPLMRTIKSLARKALKYDVQFKTKLAKKLGVKEFPSQKVFRMDASKMFFDSNSFDLVYSCSVFEHIEKAEDALRGVVRVLAPGGVAYISIHLFTSHCGSHDPMVSAKPNPEPPYWPHLRPDYANTVFSVAYLNELKLSEWYDLFSRVMPGAKFMHERQEELASPLANLRAKGELSDYQDDELLIINFIAVWKKPENILSSPIA